MSGWRAGLVAGLWLLCGAVGPAAWGADGPPGLNRTLLIESGIDEQNIRVSAGFSGRSLLIFGALDRPGGELVIEVTGPNQRWTLRRKGRMLGLWINEDQQVYRLVPAFYLVASSRRDGALADAQARRDLGLGVRPGGLQAEPADRGRAQTFLEALMRLGQQAGLFREEPGAILWNGGRLFRYRLQLPPNVPIGPYQIRVFQLHGEGLLYRSELQFHVSRTGLIAYLSSLARDHAGVYGLLCVALALLSGLLGQVVRRL